jgi:hypothetical protein
LLAKKKSVCAISSSRNKWRENMTKLARNISLLATGALMMTWTVGASAGNPDPRKLAKPAPVALGNPDTRKASAPTPSEEPAAMGNPDTRKAVAPAPEEPAAMGTPDQRTPAPKG